VAATLGLALFVYLGVQRSGFAELLGLARLELGGEEPWLVPTTVLSTSLIAIAPALSVALLLQRAARPRASRLAFIALASLALFLLMLDLDLLRSFGRHLSEVVRVAREPEGHVAGGQALQWLRPILEWGGLALSASWGSVWLARRVAQPIAQRLSPLLRRAFGWTCGVLALALVIVPHLMHAGWRSAGLYERMYAALLFDPRLGIGTADAAEPVDPVLRALAPRLRRAYREAYPALAIGEPASTAPVALGERPPNVVLLVTESLRHDVFGPELMPRLTRWAEGGLTLTQHDAGTTYSHAALFALLYGRSPAIYHQTLNAHVPPQLCVTLRASGYECAYITGHPKVWLRREEFVNPQTMDHFVHDDRGTWPDWDRRALDNLVELANHNQKPLFAIVLLMSSHFGYEYPPEYERDLPVAHSTWNVTSPRALGPEAELPHRNRYKNCMRFIDDLVSEAIGRLDPRRNLVIFTGDHGESINDDGRYTHGYSFAEIVTRTPFAMVGPGVTPGQLQRHTYHADLLPSLLHLLHGSPVSVPHVQGSDWFSDPEPTAMLLSYAPPSEYVVQGQLRTAGLRLRLDFDARSPQLTLLGFEDELGHLIPTPPLTPDAQAGLVRAFEGQLSLWRR
jgi:membrane-anchored protein YejM (alkaline phosphatase superfamily)